MDGKGAVSANVIKLWGMRQKQQVALDRKSCRDMVWLFSVQMREMVAIKGHG